MATRALARTDEMKPTLFDEFLRPLNNWFDVGFGERTITIPSVNVIESKDEYKLSLAVPGMSKDDFNIDVNNSMITISCEKEENKEEKEKNYTRKEYNYSSFSRSFQLPEEVNKEKIDARYEDGVLKVSLPKKEEAKKLVANKHITVK